MYLKTISKGAIVGALLGASLLACGSANAMTFSTPAAAAKAITESNVTDVAWVCRRVWTRWGWRRSCWRRRPVVWGAPAWGWGGPRYAWGWGRPCWNCGWGWRRRYWW